jgi:hypothetical protein
MLDRILIKLLLEQTKILKCHKAIYPKKILICDDPHHRIMF